MDDKFKRKKETLERFAKQVGSGDPLSEEFLPALPESITKQYPNRIADLRANQAGQLAEQALAQQVLKNTGVPIPSDFSNNSKTEDFFSRILKERYPEFEPNIQIKSDAEVSKIIPDAAGIYSPISKKITINQDELLTNDPIRAVSTLLHEGGHQYDDQILNFNGTQSTMAKDLVKNAPKNRLITDIDPTEAYEIMAKGHHAEIPKLREGSYGLGALKSMLKSGNFKSLAGPVAGLGLTAAMMPEDASAADFIPGLDQAENAGSAMDDREIQTEVKALQNYDNSQARRDALNRIKSGR